MADRTLYSLEAVLGEVKKASNHLGAPWVYEALREPERLVRVSLPVLTDSGDRRVFRGWHSVHSTALGPAKGPVRFCPGPGALRVQTLSTWSTMVYSVAGIPWGGSAADIDAADRELSWNEIQAVTAALALAEGDSRVPSCGSALAGRCGALLLERAACALGIDTAGSTYAVDGFGNAASQIARRLTEAGSKMVACADLWGGVHRAEGIDPQAVLRWKREHGSVRGYPGSRDIEPRAVYSLPADFLVLAGLEGSVAGKTAREVKCKVIVEAVNGPVAPGLDPILEERGVTVIPDMVVSAGRAAMSYLQWGQDCRDLRFCAEEVDRRLEKMILGSWEAVYKTHVDEKVSMREAAFRVAVGRLVQRRR